MSRESLFFFQRSLRRPRRQQFSLLIYSLPLWLHALCDALALRPTAAEKPLRLTEAWWARTALAIVLFLAILVLGSDAASEFIYFQF